MSEWQPAIVRNSNRSGGCGFHDVLEPDLLDKLAGIKIRIRPSACQTAWNPRSECSVIASDGCNLWEVHPKDVDKIDAEVVANCMIDTD